MRIEFDESELEDFEPAIQEAILRLARRDREPPYQAPRYPFEPERSDWSETEDEAAFREISNQHGGIELPAPKWAKPQE